MSEITRHDGSRTLHSLLMGLPIHKRGKYFEELFARYANLQGLHAIKNDSSCKISYDGSIKLTYTELDYTLVRPSPMAVGFFDTKETSYKRFAYSQLNPKQVERAANFNRWGVPAGFVVWYRTQNVVELITGLQLFDVGPRQGIKCGDGLFLGRFEGFDLSKLLDPQNYKTRVSQDELQFTPEPEPLQAV